MKFSVQKKHSIIMYMLEKIARGESNVSKTVSEKCNISRNTVNSYLNELQENSVIEKVKKNEYRLKSETYFYQLKRSENELNSDTYAYDNFFKQHIENCTDQAKQIWYYAFSEMVNNVMDHSNAELLDIRVEKNYFNTTVTLADDGMGIFEKIKEHFSLSSLDEARCELFKGKLTTDESNHSGEGIFFTSKIMDSFFIISSGKVFSTDKNETEYSVDINLPNVKGTVVVMSLSNFSQRQLSDVFDQYSNIEGGFTKTRIPMRNIFDNAPVSRSQAKRVCNRLDKFSEVILDFEGLEWMGQAFAHQLFVVYKTKNQKTVLTPINMSENVEKIYYHVIRTN